MTFVADSSLLTTKDIEDLLAARGFLIRDGIFVPKQHECEDRQADQVWSAAAGENPIYAATASDSNDFFAKYPALINTEIDDEEFLILDAGCGYGRIAIPLLKRNARIKIVGIDSSLLMLRKFRELLQNLKNNRLTDRVVLLHGGIATMPFEDESFDIVYSSAVLLHNPYHETKRIIGEFKRVSKAGGRLILVSSFPNRYNLEGLQSYLYVRLCVDEDTANGPVRVYSRSEVGKLFDNWSTKKIIPAGASLIPRQVGKWSLPFGVAIRKINSLMEEKVVPAIGVLCKHYDVVAVK